MINNYIHKLGLGTVQFGLDYGVSNFSGQTATADVREILQCALLNDIKTIDTASTYGTSEDVSGKFNNDNQMEFAKNEEYYARICCEQPS